MEKTIDMPRGKERRREPRYIRELPLTLLDDSKKLIDNQSRIIDISKNGLGFVTYFPVAAGETVLFRFTIPEAGLVAGKAVTCWSKLDSDGQHHIVGARISSLAWGHASRLYRFLYGGRSLQFFDLVLIALCLGLGMWILSDNQTNSFAAGQMINDAFTWLPQVGVMAISVIGLVVFFRR